MTDKQKLYLKQALGVGAGVAVGAAVGRKGATAFLRKKIPKLQRRIARNAVLRQRSVVKGINNPGAIVYKDVPEHLHIAGKAPRMIRKEIYPRLPNPHGTRSTEFVAKKLSKARARATLGGAALGGGIGYSATRQKQ